MPAAGLPLCSRVMLHQPSGGAQGQASDIAIMAKASRAMLSLRPLCWAQAMALAFAPWLHQAQAGQPAAGSSHGTVAAAIQLATCCSTRCASPFLSVACMSCRVRGLTKAAALCLASIPGRFCCPSAKCTLVPPARSATVKMGPLLLSMLPAGDSQPPGDADGLLLRSSFLPAWPPTNEMRPFCWQCCLQEILKIREMLTGLYVKHTGQAAQRIGKFWHCTKSGC